MTISVRLEQRRLIARLDRSSSNRRTLVGRVVCASRHEQVDTIEITQRIKRQNDEDRARGSGANPSVPSMRQRLSGDAASAVVEIHGGLVFVHDVQIRVGRAES